MGVNTVTNTNTDLSIYKKINNQKTTSSSTPTYMTKNGSVFDAPGVKGLYGSSSSAATKSLNSSVMISSNNNSTQSGAAVTTGESSSLTSAESLANSKNASEGRAAAKEAQNQQVEVRSGTSQSEQNTSKTNDISSNSQEVAKQIKKDDQSFKSQNNKSQSSLKRTNQQINTISAGIQAEQAELNGLNKELESLLNADKTGIGSNSAFSLNLAGTEQSGSVDNGNSDLAKIQDLQTRIGEKSNTIKIYNQQVTVLTKQSTASLRSMDRINTTYVKNTQKSQKAAEANQNEVSGFMKFANKFNEISTTVTNIGTAVKYAGMAFIAMGGIPIIGAALAAAGNVMKPIGEATETIGNYGQAAANTLMAAGNIAEGNLAGALTNIATAVQTGAAAVKSTKQLSSDFKEMSKQSEGIAKNAENVTKDSDKLQQQAADKVQEGANAPGEITDKPVSPGELAQAQSTQAPDKLNPIGTTPTETASIDPKFDPNAPLEKPKLEVPEADIPDKIEIKEGSGLDKMLKSADADKMKEAKELLRKENAEAALKELKADSKKIQTLLTALGQKGNQSKAGATSEESKQIDIELSDQAKKILAQGETRRNNIRARYGTGSTTSTNPIFYMNGRRIA